MNPEEFFARFPASPINTNCLKDFACPECGNRSRFAVNARITAYVEDQGTDPCEGSDTEWDNDSYCTCEECGVGGQVADFTIEGLDEHLTIRKMLAESKERHPGMLLIATLEDSFAIFGDDAERAGKVLGIKAEGSLRFEKDKLENYLHKLMNAGCKVAIMEKVK